MSAAFRVFATAAMTVLAGWRAGSRPPSFVDRLAGLGCPSRRGFRREALLREVLGQLADICVVQSARHRRHGGVVARLAAQ